MEAQRSNQTENAQFSELGQRMARMETKMDFVATHRDLAGVRTEIAATHKDEATFWAGVSRQVILGRLLPTRNLHGSICRHPTQEH